MVFIFCVVENYRSFILRRKKWRLSDHNPLSQVAPPLLSSLFMNDILASVGGGRIGRTVYSDIHVSERRVT